MWAATQVVSNYTFTIMYKKHNGSTTAAWQPSCIAVNKPSF